MLSEEVIRKIRRIEIRSRRTVTDVFAGEYKSVFKGKGMEFLEVREYFPGDDIRTIDWNVTARTGTPYVKKFAEERELTLMILLDASASFDFGTRSRIKRELAAEIGGVLAFCSLRNNDKLSLAVFTDKIEKFIPPAKGTAHVLTTIKEILYFKPENKKTDMKLALEYISRVMAKRFILFIISDFLTPGYEKALKIVSKKQDVVPIRILDPLEIELPPAGVVELEDPESMQTIIVDTSDSQFRKNFILKRKEKYESVSSFFKNAGIDCIDIRTNEDYIKPLIKFFAMRARRMR
jgi:uncharacterized protein (DUF58 family)